MLLSFSYHLIENKQWINEGFVLLFYTIAMSTTYTSDNGIKQALSRLSTRRTIDSLGLQAIGSLPDK